MFASKDTLLTRPSGGYNIARSVRIRASAQGYFSKTLTTPTNNKKWTYSVWMKRGSLSANRTIMSSNVDGAEYWDMRFNTSDQIYIQNRVGSSNLLLANTTAVYRDPSAWYHIVFAFDSANATAANRNLLYVNGVNVALSANSGSSDASAWNASGVQHNIGVSRTLTSGGAIWAEYDGYEAEINFIDGQALTPSSFGETDSITGVWKPKAYSGTYGTNGFYLNFSDNSSVTTSSNVGIGKDFSGNGNYWTSNNINVTAYSGTPPNNVNYDSMTDVPTLTSATAANYCVLNPLNKSSSSTVSNGNLRQTSSGGWYRAYSTIFFASTAVFYAEATMTALNSGANGVRVGIANANSVFTYLGSDANSWSYDNQGPKYNNGTLTSYGASYAQGDIIGILFNNGSLTFYKNGTSQGVAYSGLTGTFCFAGSPFDTDIVDWNFGQRPFSNLPSGAFALNTYNLPASTITNGAAYMAATTYTGNLTGQSITNTASGASFQPDWVWIKSRSAATDHKWTDSVRGATKALISNTTAAETTDLTGLTAFNSNGFTVGASTVYNNTGVTYVGWQWKAGTTSASNTNGTITSTVSVGATQGFSVVTYTGQAGAGTVGHGLNVAPSMIIVKSRSNGAYGWAVWNSTFTQSEYILLETTAGKGTVSNYWNSSAPSTWTSAFGIGSAAKYNNNSGDTFVAYCFAAVAGYSAFGSYTGNGSADGPFVYCGFRPRFILVKSSSGAFDWHITDTSRSPYNQADTVLFPNSSATETSGGGYYYDLLSNGFKCRNLGSATNGSGATYIFAAFAESPFKTSLAR